jgi:lysylphosphatidylglycerol synthetase-like protein (DUF2156 family)
MRYGADAPKGVIDYLLTECMLWGKANGFRWFSLGMAPLAGLEEMAGALLDVTSLISGGVGKVLRK